MQTTHDLWLPVNEHIYHMNEGWSSRIPSLMCLCFTIFSGLSSTFWATRVFCLSWVTMVWHSQVIMEGTATMKCLLHCLSIHLKNYLVVPLNRCVFIEECGTATSTPKRDHLSVGFTNKCGTKARLSFSGGPHAPVNTADSMENAGSLIVCGVPKIFKDLQKFCVWNVGQYNTVQ